jgi:hypothetical protein
VARLTHLVAMPLEQRATAPGAHDDARANCTHLFDLAGLAVAHAWRHARGGSARRRYDVVVPDRDEEARTTATLRRDGEACLTWHVAGPVIAGPAPFEGVPLLGAFLAWAEGALDPEVAEAAIVLRRVVWISQGREHPFPTGISAIDAAQRPGVCHSFQPDTIRIARWTGRQRDFTGTAGPLAGSGRGAASTGT